MTIETVNPVTGEVIHRYDEMTETETASIIASTHEAFLKWRDYDFPKRGDHMRSAAKILRQNKKAYASLIALEMGKPVTQGMAEIEKCARTCEHYADNASAYLAPRLVQTEMQKSYVAYRPLGVIFAIMPWNFPFWQVFRFAVPTLMAGNAAVLKHAPISTGTALIIEKIFQEANFPENLFRSLILTNEVAEKVIQNPIIAAVTLTGSDLAGKTVGTEAASQIKKTVLELGGSDPYIVLEDADLEVAANTIVTSRMSNAGQSCIAAKRIIALASIQNALLQLIQDKISSYQMGDPSDEKTNFGPLARKDLRDKVHLQVTKSMQNGAKLILGGQIPQQKGFYYPPTILVNVQKGMPAYDEEIFGPVISFITASDEEEAIQIANDTHFGLGAAVFTKDLARGEKIALEKIQAGTCVVNTLVASDPRLPFGGIKSSGHGRELAEEGIREFVNVKTIHIK